MLEAEEWKERYTSLRLLFTPNFLSFLTLLYEPQRVMARVDDKNWDSLERLLAVSKPCEIKPPLRKGRKFCPHPFFSCTF